MPRPNVELVQAAGVIHVRVRHDRRQRSFGRLPETLHERQQRGETVAGVDHEIHVPALDQPRVCLDRRVGVRLPDPVDAVPRVLDREPRRRDVHHASLDTPSRGFHHSTDSRMGF
jgi:hypothetical protein